MVSLKDNEAAMWAEYKRTKSKESFDALVEHYMPFARDRAERRSRWLVRHADPDDLFQDACLGLMCAVRAFKPGGAASFTTYARRRVDGAMTDGLRDRDWVSRLARTRQKKALALRESLQYALGREPTDEAVFDAMPETLKLHDEKWSASLRRMYTSWAKGDMNPPTMLSLDGVWGKDDDALREIDVVADEHLEALDAAMQRGDLKAFIMRSLSAQDKAILELYYYQGVPQKRIGAMLGLHASTVYVCVEVMLHHLQKKFADRKDEFAV